MYGGPRISPDVNTLMRQTVGSIVDCVSAAYTARRLG